MYRPYNKSLLINAWYRPPNSDINFFDVYADFLCKCEAENKELLVLEDLNCDVSKTPLDYQARKLQFLCSLYQFDQLINEPTRVTPTSASLIDLILTNKPENISQSVVVHLGISDHSLIFAIRKLTLPNCLGILKINLPVQTHPGRCGNHSFLKLLIAPLRQKRLRQDAIPWINPQVKQCMRKRDFHKKQAIQHDSLSQWLLYSLDLGLLVLFIFLIFSAFSHEKTGTR